MTVGDVKRGKVDHICTRMQMMYTIGQRLIFFFPITAMWLIGPTAMVVTSAVVTAGVCILDRWDPKHPARHLRSLLSPTASNARSHASQASPREGGAASTCMAAGARARGTAPRADDVGSGPQACAVELTTAGTSSAASDAERGASARDAAARAAPVGVLLPAGAQNGHAHHQHSPLHVLTSVPPAAVNGASGSLSASSGLLETAHSSPLRSVDAGAVHVNETYDHR